MKSTRSVAMRFVAVIVTVVGLAAVIWLAGLMAGRPTSAAPLESPDGLINGTIVIPAAADNTLYQSALGTLSNGAGQHFFVGRTADGNVRRALIRFNTGVLPPWTTVVSSTMTFNMSKTISGTSVVSAHPATTAWGEGASDALGEEGGGATAMPGDATWLHSFFNTHTWNTPGGDFDATASASTIVAGNGLYNWSSPGLVADVQQWVSDPATNFGWVILGNEAADTSAKRFDSRENGIPANVPRLQITFSVVLEQIALPVILK
jgi:hypothetical protein